MKIRVGFSFLVFNALLFMFRDSRLIAGFYIACIVHELGHIAVIRLTGGRVRGMELSCFGIGITASPSHDIRTGVMVLLGGPLADLLLYAVLKACGMTGWTSMFCLAEGLFNLLPFSSLDGGAVLELLISGSPHEYILNKIIFCLRALLISCGIVCAAWFIFSCK